MGTLTSATAQLTFNLATLDSSFNLGASSNVNNVTALAVPPDGKILVGGDFASLGGQPRSHLARLNADGTLASGFDPEVVGWLPFVYAQAMQADGKVLVGGFVPSLGGQGCGNLGRLNADGTVDSAFVLDTDTFMYSVAMQTDGKILVGGGWITLWGPGIPSQGLSRLFVARLNADGTVDGGYNPGTAGGVYVVAVQPDGKILIAGDFYDVGGQPRRSLARLNADGTVDPGFDPGPDGAVFSLVVQADGKILVGGSFATLGGGSRAITWGG